jgi:hypothetical protein
MVSSPPLYTPGGGRQVPNLISCLLPMQSVRSPKSVFFRGCLEWVSLISCADCGTITLFVQ